MDDGIETALIGIQAQLKRIADGVTTKPGRVERALNIGSSIAGTLMALSLIDVVRNWFKGG